MYRQIRAAMSWIERLCDTLAVASLAAIMLIVFVDTLLRYVFNSPFFWSQDFISLYLTVASFYFVVSSTFVHGGHIRIDILSKRFPIKTQQWMEIFICISGGILFFLITYLMGQRGWESLIQDERLSGYVQWQMWPSIALVPLGCGLLGLRLFLTAIDAALDLAAGRSSLPNIDILNQNH